MGGRTKVLLVSGDNSTRLAAFSNLSSFGHEVMAATSGEQADELLRSGMRFDVLVADVDLPEPHDGLALAKLARDLDRRIHVIYTARIPHRVPEARKVKGAPVIRTPYWPQQLVGLIGELRGRPSEGGSLARLA
jgi:CheY-like chemotaxis protein